MATQTQQQRRWYNDREIFLHGFVRSNYVTSFTDWFMSLAGKATELVLYATVLYSCAQLYPGVSLPSGLSLAVFLIQMGALDVGGLSLGKLAKQAREDGNTAGARQAEILSRWLISIMLVGVVTVGLEHALPVELPSWVIVSIDVLLVVARSVCSVLYGRVVHSLKHEMARMIHVDEVQARFATFTEHLTEIERRITERLECLPGEQNVVVDLTSVNTTLQEHTRLLAELATLPSLIETQWKQALQEIREANATRPRLSLVGASAKGPARNEVSVKTSESEMDKGAFVRSCLTEHPGWRNADIQRAASEHGVNISPAHISQIRKAFSEEQQSA